MRRKGLSTVYELTFDFLGLFKYIIDMPDHIERLFGNSIMFSV